MSDGSEFQVFGAATEKARRANSVRVLAADSIGASEDRSGRTGTKPEVHNVLHCRQKRTEPWPQVWTRGF